MLERPLGRFRSCSPTYRIWLPLYDGGADKKNDSIEELSHSYIFISAMTTLLDLRKQIKLL